jgi:hypothetical protein
VLDTVDTDIDYIAQLSAAHALLQREKVADQLLTSAITKREEFVKNATGILNQMHAEDDWIDHMHTATYQGAARSMAAVGMLAPLAESLFYHSFSGIHRLLETNSIPVGSSVLDTHLPNDLRHSLQALFMYRNKMFQWGFEWPTQQRENFQKQLTRWPPEWFTLSTTDQSLAFFT